MTAPDVETVRLAMHLNGYTPLPNYGKICQLKGWPNVQVNPAVIKSWSRFRGLPDTGVRIENELCVFDIDINDPVIDQAAEAIEKKYPRVKSSLLRYGKGHKEAWFFKTIRPFARFGSRHWAPPGGSEGERAAVEAFGGGVARQFGCLGAHTRGVDGEVKIAYAWADGRSPVTVPLDQLPLFEPEEVEDFIAITELILEGNGWSPQGRALAYESKPDKVFDLNDEMWFECNDGEARRLRDLEAIRGGSNLRCSASWLEPDSLDVTRCLVGWSVRLHCVTVWEAKSGQTHLPADRAPVQHRARQAALSLELQRRRIARGQPNTDKSGS